MCLSEWHIWELYSVQICVTVFKTLCFKCIKMLCTILSNCYLLYYLSLILQLADSLIIINLWIVYDLPYVTADNLIRNRIKINVFSRRWFSFCLIIYRETLSKNYIILCQKSYSTSPVRNYHIWDFKAQEDWYLSECFL